MNHLWLHTPLSVTVIIITDTLEHIIIIIGIIIIIIIRIIIIGIITIVI